jgi:Glucose-6-phosphate dehydrogenase, C-terminal domain
MFVVASQQRPAFRQPSEGSFHGSRRRLQEVCMDFRYGMAFAVLPPEAYERLLLDVMLGNPRNIPAPTRSRAQARPPELIPLPVASGSATRLPISGVKGSSRATTHPFIAFALDTTTTVENDTVMDQRHD